MDSDMATSNYIKPGEFCFCSRCGRDRTCTPGTVSRICRNCVPVRPPFDKHEYTLELARDRVGLMIYALRDLLARWRREAGMKPKFWMG